MTRRSLLLLVLTAAILSANPLAAQDEGLVAFVDSIAADHIDAGHLAGMSVAVVRGADTLVFKGYGHADLEFDIPMPTDAIHEIGSVTKQFTSVALLQLWEEGEVDLDADFTEYLPDYDTRGHTVTVRRLLDHTSGIQGYTEMASFGSIATQRLPRDTLVALFEAEPFQFEPGGAVIYNNSAFFLLGLIIEEISGQSYADYLEEHVFPLAGMDDSSYCDSQAIWPKRAHGYAFGNDALRRAGYIDHTWPYAAGSLCSTLGDMVAWLRALHGGEVLSDRAYEALVTPVPLADGTPIRYAMGITNFESREGHVIAHGGGIPGFLTDTRYYPDDDVSIVVLFNTQGPPGPTAVAMAIAERMFGAHLPEAMPYPGDLRALTGMYRGASRGGTMTMVVDVDDEGRLTAGAPASSAPQVIEYMGDGTFFRGNGRYSFEVEGDRPARLRVDQVSAHYVLEALDPEDVEEPEIDEATMRAHVGTYRFAPQFAIEVTFEDGRLHGQATGQARYPLFADSDNEYHLEVVEASVTFVVEDGETVAMILRQGGRDQRAEKVR